MAARIIQNRGKAANESRSVDVQGQICLQEESVLLLQKEWTMDALWAAIDAFAGTVFVTAKGLEFRYQVKGYEIFVDRKEKSITRSSVELAFQKARELREEATGPKKLGVFGARYLYPVFIRLGVIQTSG